MIGEETGTDAMGTGASSEGAVAVPGGAALAEQVHETLETDVFISGTDTFNSGTDTINLGTTSFWHGLGFVGVGDGNGGQTHHYHRGRGE